MKAREEFAIPISQAAQLIGFDSSALAKLVRSHDVTPLEGKRGKGGQLRLYFRDLPILEAAARLADLGVPRPSVRELSIRGIASLRAHPDADLLLSHRGKDDDDVLVAPDQEAIRRIVQDGVAAVIVEAKRGRQLMQRFESMRPQRQRGRPRLRAEYVERKLSESSELGENVDDPAAEIRRLSGE
jgi:hypothetical protein